MEEDCIKDSEEKDNTEANDDYANKEEEVEEGDDANDDQIKADCDKNRFMAAWCCTLQCAVLYC